jgi:hypothetical protein
MARPTSTIDEQNAQLVRVVSNIPPWRMINAYLVDSNGSTNLAVDGSGGAPKVFSYTPPSLYDFNARRILIFMLTSSAMSVTAFGNLGAALGAGIEIKAQGVLLTTWKDNIDLYTEFYEADSVANLSDATPDTTLSGRWVFYEDTGGQGILVPNGQSFEVIVNDDLSAITELRIRIKGELVARES